MKHTQGKLKAVDVYLGTDEEDSQTIAYMDDHRNKRRCSLEEREANAQHLAACWNACEGINPEAVPDILAALDAALDEVDQTHAEGYPEPEWADAARAAMAKARPEVE